MNRMQLYQLLVENGNDRAEARSIVESVAEEDLKNLNSDLVDLDEILDALGIEVEEEEDDDEDADDEDEEEDLTPDPRSARQAELSARAHAGAQPASESAVKEQGSDAQLNPLSTAWGSFAKALPPQVKNVDRKVVVGSAIAMVVLLFIGCIALSSFVLAIWPTNENMATPVAVFETPSTQDGGFLIPFETPEQGVINDAFGIGGEPVAQAPETIVTPTVTPTPVNPDWWQVSSDTDVFDATELLRKAYTLDEWAKKTPWGLLAFMVIGPMLLYSNLAKDRAASQQRTDIKLVNGAYVALFAGMFVAELLTIGGQMTSTNIGGNLPFWAVVAGILVGNSLALGASVSGQTDLSPSAVVAFVTGIWLFGWYGADLNWAIAGYMFMLVGATLNVVEINRLAKTKQALTISVFNAAAFYLLLLVTVIIGWAVTQVPVSDNSMVRAVEVVLFRLINWAGPFMAVAVAAFLMDAVGDKVAGILKDVMGKSSEGSSQPMNQTARYDAQNMAWMWVYLTCIPVINAIAMLVAM